MTETTTESISPIAIYRHEGAMLFWADTPDGWEVLNAFSLLSAQGKRIAAQELFLNYLEVEGPTWVRYPAVGIAHFPAEWPQDLPVNALIGTHISFMASDAPQWRPGVVAETETETSHG